MPESIETNAPKSEKIRGSEFTIRIDKAYGRKLLYPADKNAELFAKLLGAKTFTAEQVQAIEGLGYVVQVQADNNWKA